MSEDFDELFDSSILESLEGALQEFSQLNSTTENDSDEQNGTDEEDEGEDDDQSQYTEYTDYTDHTYGTDFDGDEDPESGEHELFAMMDSLVAELEMEIDNLEKGDVISGDMPLVILDDETGKRDENKEVLSPPKPEDLDYAPVSDYTNDEKPVVADLDDGADGSSMSNEQGEKNYNRAKSLWKILSGLTHPYLDDDDDDDNDVANKEEISEAEIHEEGEENGNKSPPEEDSKKASEENANFEKVKTANSGDADYTNVSDYTETVPVKQEYTNLKTPTVGDADYMEVSDYTKKPPSKEAERAAANAARSSYVPSKEDFQQLVGVLAEYTKRRRQQQRSSRDNLKYKDEEPEPLDDELDANSIKNFTGVQAVPDFRMSAADTTFDKVEVPTSEDPDYVPISDYSPMRKSVPDYSTADTTFDNVVLPTSNNPDYVPISDYSQQQRLNDNEYEEGQEVVDELNNKSSQEATGLQGPPDFGWESPADATFEKVELPTSKDPDYVPISDYSPIRKTRNGETFTPVDNSQAASLTEGERKKTGRAIASYTMKKRREYMMRKRQQMEEKDEPAHVTSGSSKQEEAVKSTNRTQANVAEKSSPSKVTRSNGQRRKKKKKRTNKHRKGKPKKLEGSPAKQPQQEQMTESQGAESATRRARARARVRVRTRQDDQQMRTEVIRALAETEAWHWIVKQVTAQYN